MSTPRLEGKVANIFVMVFVWCKMPEKITANYKSFGKMNLVILRSHRKVHQNFLFNFEDNWKKNCILPDQILIAFFHTGKPDSPRVLVET